MSSSSGTTVGGQPETIPPMGQTSAGLTVAGPPTMAQGGQQQMIAPMGQTSAGIIVSGMPQTIPPMGQTSAGITVAGPTTMAPGGQEQTVPRMGQSSTKSTTSTSTGSQTPLQGTVCIASTGSTMDAQVAPLFDRAPYFLMVGLGNFRVIRNPNERDQTGVGIQSAQLIVSEGAKAVITDDIGVRGLEELSRLRVRVYTGVNGTARQALEWYQNGRLSPASLNNSNTEEEEHGSSSGGKAKAKGESRSL